MGFKTFNAGDVLTASDVNTYLMKQAVISCTSGTRPSSPAEGMLIYETDTDVFRVWNGSAWRRCVIDVETNAPQQAENTSTFTFTNTTAAAGATVVGVTFTGPPSGAVFVTVSGNIGSDQAPASATLGYEVRTGSTIGSGTIVLANNFVRAVMSSEVVNTLQQARVGASHRYMLTGLTAGSSYNARTMHWITVAGQGTVYHRSLLVEPVL